jgi:hypothetical protein
MVQAHQPDEAVFRSILPEEIDWKPFPAFPPRPDWPRRPKLQIRRRVVVADHSAISLRFWRPWAWRGRAASHPRTSLRSSWSPFPGKSDFRVQRQNGHNVRRGRVRESRDQVDRAGRRQYVGIWGRSGKSPPCGD